MTKRNKSRLAISAQLRDQVLLDSKRRCAICFAELKADDVKEGAVTHIRPSSAGIGEPSVDNLVFLCSKHHDQLERGQLPAEELQTARDNLYKSLAEIQSISHTKSWSPALRYEQRVSHLLEGALRKTFGRDAEFESVSSAGTAKRIEGVDFSAEVSFHGIKLWIVAEVRFATKPIGPDAIRGFIGALATAHPSPNKGIFVTNSSFSRQAATVARAFSVSLFVVKDDADEWSATAVH